MTYGNRMSARHRRPDEPGEHEPGGDPTRTGPLIGTDGVVFRVADAEHALDGVRLEVDWMLGYLGDGRTPSSPGPTAGGPSTCPDRRPGDWSIN